MPQKTASPAVTAWAYRLSYLAAAMWLVNALTDLTGWGNFAKQPPSLGWFALAESVVFFAVGAIFQAGHCKAKARSQTDPPPSPRN